jgi:hypothetical protein
MEQAVVWIQSTTIQYKYEIYSLYRYLQQLCVKLPHSWFQIFVVFWMLYAFFWVIPRRLNFICQRFGKLCLFHLHTHSPMKMEQTVFQNVGI